MESTENWQRKVYRPGTMDSAGSRGYPSKQTRTKLLAQYNNSCFYCQIPFGTVVTVELISKKNKNRSPRRGRTFITKVTWDHKIPYSWSLRNNATNWLPACAQCNSIKSDLMFKTVDKAVDHILSVRKTKGYRPVHRRSDITNQGVPLGMESEGSAGSVEAVQPFSTWPDSIPNHDCRTNVVKVNNEKFCGICHRPLQSKLSESDMLQSIYYEPNSETVQVREVVKQPVVERDKCKVVISPSGLTICVDHVVEL